MAQPFYIRLREYFGQVGLVLQGSAAVASIFPNTTDIGQSRERVYAEVLRQHLPRGCNVFLGGFLFNLAGNESKQIDIIVTTDRALQFNFHNPEGLGKSFASTEGCIGVASVKSRLTTAELKDALENLASLPEKQPLDGRLNPAYKLKGYEDWPYKIVYASDGASVGTIHTSIGEFYREHPEIPLHRRPNLVHVAGKYGIVRAPEDTQFDDGVPLKKGSYSRFVTDPDLRSLLLTIIELEIASAGASQMTFDFKELLRVVPWKSDS